MIDDPGLAWHLEPVSLILGLIVGIILVLTANRVRLYFLRVGDSTRKRYRQFRARFGEGDRDQYREALVRYLQGLHLHGMSSDLENLYVESRIFSPLLNSSAEQNANPYQVQLYYLWPELAQKVALTPLPTVTLKQFLRKSKRAIISSAPGTGKTSLLAYCALLSCNSKEGEKFDFLLDALPIYVHLADLPLDSYKSAKDRSVQFEPFTPLDSAIRSMLGKAAPKSIRQLIENQTHGKSVLLLVDGWDELDLSEGAVAAIWLDLIQKEMPSAQIIVAVGLDGYGPLLELDFLLCGLMPWRVGQAGRLGLKLAQSRGRLASPPAHTYWRPGQTPVETYLRALLFLDSDEGNGEGGSKRLAFLMEDTLARLIDKTTSSQKPWLGPAVKSFWQEIAFNLLSRKAMSLPMVFVEDLSRNILANQQLVANDGEEKALVESLWASGLFVKRQGDRLGFLSPVWRDFLAGSYLADHFLEGTSLEKLGLAEWKEALRYYVSLVGATALSNRIFEQPFSQAGESLFQMASWMPEVGDTGEWRRQTLVGLGRLVVSSETYALARHRAILALAITGEEGVLVLLRQLISQEDPAIRQTSMASIVGTAPSVGVNLMERMTTDANELIRRCAVHALAWVNDPAAEKPLIRALLEPDDILSWTAAEGLALNGTEKSIDILREAATDKVLSVRRAAVHGLSMLEDDWAISLLHELAENDSQWVVRAAAQSALEEIVAESDTKKWQAPQAGDQDWFISWSINQGRAVPAGQAAVPLLTEALGDSDPEIRIHAAETLGLLGARDGYDALLTKLHDKNPRVRDAIYMGLCQISSAWGFSLSQLPSR